MIKIKQDIKIGRWTYPLGVIDGRLVRNAKRDGSGEWVEVTVDQMDGDQQKALITKAPKESEDYALLREIYLFIFDDHSVDYDGISEKFNLRPGRAKAAVSRLVNHGLVNVDHIERPDGKGKQYVIQANDTYDNWSREEAVDGFNNSTMPKTVKIPNPSTHGGVKGAQTRKPGKSTWKVGSPCPQGHKLKKGDIYTMPNGRHICRVCRSEYKSVQARKAKAGEAA